MPSLTAYKRYLTITGVAWAACLLVFVAAYMVLLKPQANRKRHLENKLIELKQEHEAAKVAAQEQTKIELSAQITQLREKLEAFVTDYENAADLKFDITQMAREKEVASLSVGSGKKNRTLKSSVSDSNSIEESNIDISFVSGFNQFASIVNSLERHRPVILVHEFELDRSHQNKSVYQVTLDVRALVKKQQEPETAKLSSAPLYSAKK
jgi:Tfp pilus assembly protein PilO